jgi:hypothetical protein
MRMLVIKTRPDRRRPYSRLSLLAVVALLMAGIGSAWLIASVSMPLRAESVVVTMSPWCGCCGEWVDYMRRAGFPVEVVETEEVEGVKQAAGVPSELYSCHTAEIAGYVVEGHVPLPAIKKLLAEQPVLAGVALAGMPPGSPGMGGEPWLSYPVEGFTDGLAAGRFMDSPLR